MKIFVDFDDVLFNTKRFREDLIKVFIDHGVSREIFKQYYYGFPKEYKGRAFKKYNVTRHLRALKKVAGIKISKTRNDVYDFIKSSGKYVFSDTVEFLRKFRKNELYLISLSKTDFQRTKIKYSGLERFFVKIIIVDEVKSGAVRSLITENGIKCERGLFFLDDRVKQVNAVKKACRYITTILVKRKEGRYRDKKSKYCDYQVKSLSEAKKVIIKAIRNYE